MDSQLLYSSPGLKGLLKSLAISSNLSCALYDEKGELVEEIRDQGHLASFLWNKEKSESSGLHQFEAQVVKKVNETNLYVKDSFLSRLEVIAHPLYLLGNRKGVIVLGYVLTHFPTPEDCKTFAKTFDLNYLQVWHEARKESPSTSLKLEKFSYLFRDVLESHLTGVYGSLQLQAADLLKDEFLSIVSHELKTPLSAGLLRLQVLCRKLEAKGMTEEVTQLLQGIKSLQGQEMIIDDLLDVSRITQGKLRYEKELSSVNELAKFCADEARQMIEEKGLEFHFHPLEEDEKLYMDSGRMKQVILNLLNNARKFTKSGSVTLSLEVIDGRVRFKVEDTGVGLDPDELHRVFNKFMQSAKNNSYKGLGLGLFLAEQIIRSHNGRIFATSAGENQGAAFIAEIPVGDGRSKE